MILRTYTITLEPKNPREFSSEELRSFFHQQLLEYTQRNNGTAEGVIYRYPAVQCKLVKGNQIVIGISQGADLLWQLVQGTQEVPAGRSGCTIVEQDTAIRNESFGVTETMHPYEFVSPWRALNQQNTKKFYHLKGKPSRDAFMQKILGENLMSLAKSLDCRCQVPVTAEAHVRFRHDIIDDRREIVFLGTFETNLQIPSYFGIGQSISRGFGTIRQLPSGLAANLPANPVK